MRVDRAFEALYEEEFPAVFRAAYVLCGDRQLAEDATQEAFARALERWRRLRDQPWVGGWVTSTALNIVRRSLRRRARMPAFPADVASRSEPEEAVDLWRAVRELPPRQQEAVVLHHVVDLSVADCARIMRCSEGSVKRHLSRARASLAAGLIGDPS